MPHASSFAGVILAAGESARMGTDKALLPWPPSTPGQAASKETFLSAAIRSLSQAADFVIVVAGKNEVALAPVVYSHGASMVVNPDPARGQFSSLQAGLREVLSRGRDAAMITLVDRPPASAATVRKLRDAFEASGRNIWAVVPEYSGRHGHPFICGREMIEAFLQAPPASTARDVEHRHQAHIEYVPVDDPLVAVNVNTPDDYASLRNRPGG
jgi:molybdenum cofactor cytidylyltransferase